MRTTIDGQFTAIPQRAFSVIAERGTPTHYFVLASLVWASDRRSGVLDASMDEVAEICNLSRETVKKVLRWLEKSGLIQSETLQKNRGKRYRVMYREDPQGGSSDTQRGGNTLPPKMASEQGFCAPIDNRNILVPVLVEIPNGISTNVCDDYEVHEGETVILGADPAFSQKIETRFTPTKKQQYEQYRKEVSVIVDYFNFVARKTWSNPVQYEDFPTFRKLVHRDISGGLSVKDMKGMIDEFFRSSAVREHPIPWKLFMQATLHQQMIAKTKDPMVLRDSFLNWLGSGSPDNPPLGWSDSYAEDFFDATFIHGEITTYTYPDVLGSIAIASTGDIALAKKLMNASDSLINWYHTFSTESVDSERQILTSAGVWLPPELMGKRLRSKPIRKKCNNVRQAIINSQQVTTQHN